MDSPQTPRFGLTCVKCSKVHPLEVQNEWGKHPGTQGLGPRPCCPALVDVPGREGQAACRGMLVAHQL